MSTGSEKKESNDFKRLQKTLKKIFLQKLIKTFFKKSAKSLFLQETFLLHCPK